MKTKLFAIGLLLSSACLVSRSSVASADSYPEKGSRTIDVSKQPSFSVEWLSAQSTGNPPLTGGAIATGTSPATAGAANHPGLTTIKSHAGNANSGYWWIAGGTALLISGSEEFQCVFRVDTLTDLTVDIGFHDSSSSTAPVDGVYFVIPSTGALIGQTSAANAKTSTSTSYTISAGTWYRVRATLNQGATLATFYLYSEAGALLWAESISLTIPTAAGQETGIGVTATKSSAGTVDMITLDYFGASFSRDLVR